MDSMIELATKFLETVAKEGPGALHSYGIAIGIMKLAQTLMYFVASITGLKFFFRGLRAYEKEKASDRYHDATIEQVIQMVIGGLFSFAFSIALVITFTDWIPFLIMPEIQAAKYLLGGQ